MGCNCTQKNTHEHRTHTSYKARRRQRQVAKEATKQLDTKKSIPNLCFDRCCYDDNTSLGCGTCQSTSNNKLLSSSIQKYNLINLHMVKKLIDHLCLSKMSFVRGILAGQSNYTHTHMLSLFLFLYLTHTSLINFPFFKNAI